MVGVGRLDETVIELTACKEAVRVDGDVPAYDGASINADDDVPNGLHDVPPFMRATVISLRRDRGWVQGK